MPIKIDWKRVDPKTDFKYEDPRSSGSHDGFSVRVQCKDPNTGNYVPLLFQGPKMRIPFGFEGRNTPGGIKYYSPMSFPSVRQDGNGVYVCSPGNEDALAFLQFMQKIDELNLEKATQECKKWFKKEMSPTVLEEFYYKNLSTPKDAEKYSPTLSSKLIHNGTEFKTEFWNTKRERIEYEDIPAGSTVIPIISTRGLWFAGKSFGMSIQVVQMMVFETDRFNGCAIDFGDPRAEEENDTEADQPLTIDLDEADESKNTDQPASKRRRTNTRASTAVSEEFNM